MTVAGAQKNNDPTIVEENHEKFLQHLDESIEPVWICAKYLSRQGYPVTVYPMSKAPTHAEWRSHADNGDLEIIKDGVSCKIEVKCLSKSFTKREDWPFQDFMICATHSWNRAEPKPLAYMILNKERTHAGIVYGKDSSTWTKDKKFDRRYTDYEQEFYFSPLENIVWRALYE